ncbi:MAG: lactonase family protein [Pseudomonadales bacterium]|nr:lactonase family protein [Pseudomonadales bacterium]NRA17563.1 lactonase family protein [Oceanospirillaceae bacterium]
MRNQQHLYVGTYTRLAPHLETANGSGIHLYTLDLDTGALSCSSEPLIIENPSYLCIDQVRQRLFAVSEIEQHETGGISAYQIDLNSGELSYINSQQANGSAACYLSIDATGSTALLANYVTGNVCAYPVAEDGSLSPASAIVQHWGSGPNQERQEAAHAHSIVLSPDNKYAFAADLGSDQIFSYRLQCETQPLQKLASVQLQVGSGPRHLVFHPNGKFAFLISELISQVTLLSYDAANGELTVLQTINTVPQDYRGVNYPGDLHLSPDGKFLYGSNRGHDSIVIYAFDQQQQQLNLIGFQSSGGKFPRGFTIAASGRYLLVANQNSDNIVSFKRDAKNGTLARVDEIFAPTPVCLKLLNLD